MKVFLKPKEGLKIPRPDNGRVLKAEGEIVEHSTFWRRRISDGDVIEVQGKVPETSQPDVSEKKLGDKKGGSK